MSYATNSDVEQRMGPASYVQLTDDAGEGAADEVKVTAAREAAEAEINSYVGVRYGVPVDVSGEAEVAAILRSVTVDLVEFRLHSRRPPVPADVAARGASALEWLDRIASGRAVLPSVSELQGNPALGPSTAASASTRVWGRDEAADV